MARTNDPAGMILFIMYIEGLIPLIMALRPSILIRLALFATQLLVAYRAVTTFTTGDTAADYGVGGLMAAVPLCTAIHFWFFTDAFSDGTRHLDDKRDAKDLPLLQRIWWATCLRWTIRGVGWTNEAPHIRKVPPMARLRFCLTQLLKTAKFILLSDLASTFVANNPITSSKAHLKLSVASQGPLLHALTVFVWWMNGYAGLQVAYCFAAVVAVGSSLWEPQAWPPFFGSWSEAYTLRRTWGRVWHQILRRVISSFGKTATRILGISPGTNASSYTQLYVGFFLSGLIHCGGDLILDAPFGQSIPFFMYQALAITFEDACIALSERAGLKGSRSTRVLGYIWVAVWFYYTTPCFMAVIIEAGKPFVPAASGPVEAIWKGFGMEGKLDFVWEYLWST